MIWVACMCALCEGTFNRFIDRMTTVGDTELRNLCGTIETKYSLGAGAAYGFCNAALALRKGIGISLGVYMFDPWSKALSNVYGMRSDLYDCFHTEIGVSEYVIKPKINQVCVGHSETQINLDDCGYGDCTKRRRQFVTMETLLGGRDVLSTYVKMDVEGAEWDVINTMKETDFDKIVQFDLELHWCKDGANKLDGKLENKIKTAMLRLRLYFNVLFRTSDVFPEKDVNESAGRKIKSDTFAHASCGRLHRGEHDMMSISLINKRMIALLKNQTETLPVAA